METERIRELIELMVEHDLSRLEIEEGETHILLKRGYPPVAPTLPGAGVATPLGTPGMAPSADPAAPAAAQTAESSEVFIRSPMVGTFYTATEPDAPPFVSVGDVVQPDTVVCLVEAMKVFNEIKAELSGRITKVLVRNTQAVEFDQPLFAVVPG